MSDDDNRAARGREVLRRLFGSEPSANTVNADLMALSTAHLFGDVWTRPGLNLRDRELVTIAVIAALGFERQLRLHLRGALAAGLRRDEIVETFIHLAHYAGYPSGFTALALAEEVFAAVDRETADDGRG